MVYASRSRLSIWSPSGHKSGIAQMTTSLNRKWTERTCAQNPHWSPDRYIQTTPGIVLIRLTGSLRIIARSLVFICCQPFCAKSLTGFYIHSDGSRVSIRQRPEKSLSALRLGVLPAIKPLTLAGCYLGSAAGFEPA